MADSHDLHEGITIVQNYRKIQNSPLLHVSDPNRHFHAKPYIRTRGVAYTKECLDRSSARKPVSGFLLECSFSRVRKKMGKERKKKTKKNTTAAKKKGIFMSIVKIAIHTCRLNSSRLLKRVRCRDIAGYRHLT